MIKRLGLGTGISGLSGLSGLGIGNAYAQKVLDTQPANLLAYWPLNETSGATADNAEGTAARDGTYVGVTLNDTTGPDGVGGSPLFDGANDAVGVFSASLAGVFDGNTGTVAIWAEVSGAGVWTDGTLRNCVRFHNNFSNYLYIAKDTVNNQLEFTRLAAGAPSVNIRPAQTSTGWIHLALSWSQSANEMKAFVNGSQAGATAGASDIFAGTITADRANIGSFSAAAPADVWDGWLAHCAVWDVVLTPTEISALAAA